MLLAHRAGQGTGWEHLVGQRASGMHGDMTRNVGVCAYIFLSWQDLVLEGGNCKTIERQHKVYTSVDPKQFAPF